MQVESLSFAVRDQVAHITVNQPERGTPIDRRFCEEFNAIATACWASEAVRAVLIDAKGKCFSVGGGYSPRGPSPVGATIGD
jgi:2-(1,2-epoxy-1,2-dihydrophenyl)acetyl-CoA isomerase